MPSEIARSSSESLPDQARRWAGAGIVSEEQSERIVQFERARSESVAGAEPPGTPVARRLSPVAELVSYLGIVVVLASGELFVNRLWHGLALGGRLAVGVVVTLLGFGCGRVVSRLGVEGTTEFGWFFWLCGTGGVAMATAVLIDRVAAHSAGWTLLVTGLVAAAVSVGLWRNLDRPLQFFSSVAGLGLTVGGLISLEYWHPGTTTVGLVVWTAGVALGALALRVLRPTLIVTMVAQVGFFAGALAISDSILALGITFGLPGAVGGEAIGLSTRQPPVVALGVMGFFIFVARLLSFYLRGPVAILVVFVLGVALVGFVIWRATRSRTTVNDVSESRERRGGHASTH